MVSVPMPPTGPGASVPPALIVVPPTEPMPESTPPALMIGSVIAPFTIRVAPVTVVVPV